MTITESANLSGDMPTRLWLLSEKMPSALREVAATEVTLTERLLSVEGAERKNHSSFYRCRDKIPIERLPVGFGQLFSLLLILW